MHRCAHNYVCGRHPTRIPVGEGGQHVEEEATHTAELTQPQETANESSTIAASTKQSVSKAVNETVARKQESKEREPMVLSKTISPEVVYAVTREAIDHLADLYDDPLASSAPDVQMIPVEENSLDRVLNP
ncbi:MAG: hypothetical protein H0W76_19150 [Pyrinomonadaceae bacterium]|nr:hypothetical protein [Pyrinomonadaceae bacterium]